MAILWQLLLLWLSSGSCLAKPHANPEAQPLDTFDALALGALSVQEQIMDMMKDGQRVAHQMSFDLPLMKIQTTAEMGFGQAMHGIEESDERRRRRRRRRYINDVHHLIPHRSKRSPCFNRMTTAATESPDDVEARKKAAARKRAVANNASRSRVIRKLSKNKQKLYRARRQAETMADNSVGQTDGQKRPPFGERIKGLWLMFVDGVADAVQHMRLQIRNGVAQATGSAAAGN